MKHRKKKLTKLLKVYIIIPPYLKPEKQQQEKWEQESKQLSHREHKQVSLSTRQRP